MKRACSHEVSDNIVEREYTGGMNFTTHSRVAIAMLVGVFLLLPGNVHALSVTHYLNLGAQDAMTAGEVSVLQQFLAGDSSIYPQKLVTGRFGSATEAALQRLQKYWAAQDVSLKLPSSGSARTSGFGATGPRTRALLALLKTPKERATAAVVALPAAPLKGLLPNTTFENRRKG